MLILQIAGGIFLFLIIIAVLDRLIHGPHMKTGHLKSYRDKEDVTA